MDKAEYLHDSYVQWKPSDIKNFKLEKVFFFFEKYLKKRLKRIAKTILLQHS